MYKAYKTILWKEKDSKQKAKNKINKKELFRLNWSVFGC
jgi:hypothetical protein